MKKILAFMLTFAVFMTVCGTFFTFSICAKQNGEVYCDIDGWGQFITYWYDSDESAVADGAIAKFTHKSGDTVYVKTWRTLTVIGGDSEYGADTVTLISNDKTISIDSDLNGSISENEFTVEGNGITVECSGTVSIEGKDNGHVTLKDITFVNAAEDSSVLMLGKKNMGPKVTLDNVKVIGRGMALSRIVDVVSSDLVLTNGSRIVNDVTVNGSNENCIGVRLLGISPSVKINENTSVESSGNAIYTEKESYIMINGGKISSSYGMAMYVSNGSEAVVNSGSLYGGGTAVAQVSNGTLMVNGGSFYALDTDNDMLGVIVSGATNINGGSAVINGGNFYDVSGSSEWIFKCNVSKDGKHSLVLNSATTFGNDNVYSGKNGVGQIKTGTMIFGASIRTQSDSSGIRFQSTLDKDIVENIRAIDENATVGTVIAPYDHLKKTNGIFTKDALLSEGLDCLEIVADKGMTEKGDHYLINAAMTEVKVKNYGRDFVAVSYISYKTAENAVVTAYSGFDEKENVRNIVQVAYSALADVMVEGEKISDTVTVTQEYARECGYGNVVFEWYEYDILTGNAVIKQGRAYTEYSFAQRKLIKAYIDAYVKGDEN